MRKKGDRPRWCVFKNGRQAGWLEKPTKDWYNRLYNSVLATNCGRATVRRNGMTYRGLVGPKNERLARNKRAVQMRGRLAKIVYHRLLH